MAISQLLLNTERWCFRCYGSIDAMYSAQAGANTWRAVEGVMADRRISKRLKSKVMSTCVTPACLYGTETLAMTEVQQQRLQVCDGG